MKRVNSLLDNINSSADLKALNAEELGELAGDIREYILNVVSQNGGHLSSNLGVVELTIAMHYVLNLNEDKIIWDVSHQSYTHKILTGRRDFFSTLRQYEGCSGFQSPCESSDDPCFAGHAGTAISSALGVSVAKAAANLPGLAVAVVGDGALNCGVSFEALNNAQRCGKRLVIVLNDNRMSISNNVGALQSYLHRLITANRYVGMKKRIKKIIDRIPWHNTLLHGIRKFEGLTKSALLPGAVFEELGIRYLGPVDGHDIEELVRTFSHIKNSDEFPVLLHVITRKGNGYKPAELDPEAFHGVGKFDRMTGVLPEISVHSYTHAFGKTMTLLAEKEPQTVAVSAAMAYSTGLSEFQAVCPDRLFDVGIAEGHAVTFAGGLAASGLRPVVAIYATFIQRALDNVFQDVCLGNLPVIFCLDRAGLVEDGPTHNGIYDIGFFRAMPNITIMQPANENELKEMLFFAFTLNSPVVIRYPRGASGDKFDLNAKIEPLQLGKAKIVQRGSGVALWALGGELKRAEEVAKILRKKANIECEIINARFVKPLDNELLKREAAEGMRIVTIEDHCVIGGLGSAVSEVTSAPLTFGWPDKVLPHGKTNELRQYCHLTSEDIADKIIDSM